MGLVFAVVGLSVLDGRVYGCGLGCLRAMEIGKENGGGSLSVIVKKMLRIQDGEEGFGIRTKAFGLGI